MSNHQFVSPPSQFPPANLWLLDARQPSSCSFFSNVFSQLGLIRRCSLLHKPLLSFCRILSTFLCQMHSSLFLTLPFCLTSSIVVSYNAFPLSLTSQEASADVFFELFFSNLLSACPLSFTKHALVLTFPQSCIAAHFYLFIFNLKHISLPAVLFVLFAHATVTKHDCTTRVGRKMEVPFLPT